jgi:Protein of unknown function (DUF3500)
MALIESLDGEQRAALRGSIDDPRRREWTYLPGDRRGLSLERLTASQRSLVEDLVVCTHSEAGGALALGAIGIERVRRQLATNTDDVGGDRYWVRILDDPSGTEPWGWQINGHHLAVHAVVVGGVVTMTPHFIGAEPARVPSGPQRGRRLLDAEEDLARDLLAALDDGQRTIAVVSDVAPEDILTRADPAADPDLLPTGLPRAGMTGSQQAVLDQLLRRYLDRAPTGYAQACWREATEPGAGPITFAWAGPLTVGAGHYYCIKTPTFLIEYDNTQDDANHAHSVWRHLLHDFGGDPLREHYARHHARAGAG